MYNLLTLTTILDLLALGLIFWLIPLKVSKLFSNRLIGQVGSRPMKALVRELPGTVNGLAIGAFAVYAFGASFEDFAVSTARAAGDQGMKILGIDDVSRCKARMTEKYKLEPDAFYRDYKKPVIGHPDELQQIYQRLAQRHMISPDRVLPPEEGMDYALTEYCKGAASGWKGTGAINPLEHWQKF